MDKALSGIRVLDMTHVQAGPTCSQLMGFMGADVIKFEPPTGDVTRKQLRDIPDADSLYFTMLNCNKRSITVNLKNEDGKKIFADLIKSCDVVMENFGPGVLNRLGFGWEEVHEINPRIVMASIKGVGAQVSRPHARRLTRRELKAARERFETLREPQGLPVSYLCFTLQLEKPHYQTFRGIAVCIDVRNSATDLEQVAYQFTSSQFVPAKSGDINEFRAGGRTAL